MMKKFAGVIIIFFSVFQVLHSQSLVTEKNDSATFPLITSSQIASIYIDQNDDWLVRKVASLLQNDIELVTGKKAKIISKLPSNAKSIIVIGTISRSSTIDKLVKERKLNTDELKDKWECFKLESIERPFNGIENALVIVGSDKRGSAYGVFEFSQQLGISPWYWWADVPAKKKPEVYVKKGTYKFGPPSVKYRGIFINDEAPAFSGWAKEKFGGVNHQVYEKIFELLLRLKANYLWPAMWGNAFNDDDPQNPILADKYGIVMGTSHHEPMLRAQQEWKRYGKGQWNYDSNEVVLKNFWKKGIQNMGRHESIVTIGMRGDGDMPMTKGTAISLLERIVADQRKIIEQVTGKPASETPQLWALYKEVQDYYDQGMRVPDDVTLLLCDDNWGNIRRLPKLGEKPRPGGYGIYYHFDYVGGPRNYKWLNTNNIARVWEQMHLAYEYGVDRIWIVNVGDLKPMEFPISFFLDYAWDVKKWDEYNLKDYFTDWAAKQFGPTYATEIGEIVQKYSQYNARRKPELLSANTYSFNYDEAKRITSDYDALLAKAEEINKNLPAEYKDAFFQLVLHPVKASANLNDLYFTVAYNKLFASQNSLGANQLADKAKQLYLNDSLITLEYHSIAKGKWNHMMDQTHIGYTYWQQPPNNKMPEIKYVSQDSAKEQVVKINPVVKTAKNLISRTIKRRVFYEQDGYVSIDAPHYTGAVNTNSVWTVLPGIGRAGDAITTFPVTVTTQDAMISNNAHLRYDFYVYDTGQVKLLAYFSPTLNFQHDEGLKYAVSIDNGPAQVISINKDDNDQKTWEQWVANNIIIKTSSHNLATIGEHTLNFWMVSPAVILQKLVFDFGGLKPSYLAPPETVAIPNQF